MEGEDPDQDYIDKALPVIEEHMMLGANRLAALMVDIYGSSSQHAEQFLNWAIESGNKCKWTVTIEARSQSKYILYQ